MVEAEANEPDDSPKGLGLHSDPDRMRWLKKNRGKAIIPEGIYCYGKNGTCPFWDMAENRPEQGNGFCWFLGKGDWDEGIGELWDQCKCCGVNDDFVPEGTIQVVDGEEVTNAGD